MLRQAGRIARLLPAQKTSTSRSSRGIVALAGGRVLYRADQDRNDVLELFSFVGPGRPFLPAPVPSRHVSR